MIIRTHQNPGPGHGIVIPICPKTTSQTLLEEIEAFARRNRLTASGVCRQATGNGNLYDRLRNGLNPAPVTKNKIRKYMQEYIG